MKSRVFIIHGWDDAPTNGWFPWLKKRLEAQGVEVRVPAMPDAGHPTIDTWVRFVQHLVGHADEQTCLVGHSIGAQTILRYLERLPAGEKIGGAVLVAGWMNLKPLAMENEETAAVAWPWIQRPLDWPKVRRHIGSVTAIMSDDDQFVSIEDGKIFARELGASMIVEHQKRHLGGFDGVTVLPSALSATQRMLHLVQ